MAAPTKPTGTVQHTVYMTAPAAAVITTPADLAAAKAQVATELEDAISVGPIDISGNPVSYTPLGSGTTKTIAGAADLGELAIRFVPTESVALDAALSAAVVGHNTEVLVIKAVGAAEVAYYARGEVTGLSVGFDTPAETEIRFALAERPIRFV